MEAYDIGYMIGTIIGMILGAIIILSIPTLFIIGLIQAFRKKTKGWIVLTCLMGMVLLMPVAAFSYGLFKAASGYQKHLPKQKVSPEQKVKIPENREIISKDGLCKLTIPPHWILLEGLNEEASIQAGNRQQKQYLVVFSDLKEDFDGTFENHADFTSSKLINGIEKGQRSEPETLEIGGYKAIRYNMTGCVKRTKLIYLHTTFEGERSYHQVLVWTIPSKAEESMKVFEGVLKTFEEIPK
jgi:hypothetical protein